MADRTPGWADGDKPAESWSGKKKAKKKRGRGREMTSDGKKERVIEPSPTWMLGPMTRKQRERGTEREKTEKGRRETGGELDEKKMRGR